MVAVAQNIQKIEFKISEKSLSTIKGEHLFFPIFLYFSFGGLPQ